MPPFYQLSKEERTTVVKTITADIAQELKKEKFKKTVDYFSDADTYIRKTAYLAAGRIYFSEELLKQKTIGMLQLLLQHTNFKIRQTVINAAGEIGRKEFKEVQHFFDSALFDEHHSVRNAVIGSVKKMAEVNTRPVLQWAKKYLHHPDKEIRREICHGIELRGRKYPQDILPLLQELQHDKTARVRNTLVHVIGQIAYKKNCLAIVVQHLQQWNNKALVKEALEEIIDVHYRYRNFSALTQQQAREYISNNYK